mmetsp:Transcript_14277/g.20865  ORF Transcript_14277/g.20865 Transcript_14277/m.20865 type:complete len:304 (-) Transcript_14277:373-1284(-)
MSRWRRYHKRTVVRSGVSTGCITVSPLRPVTLAIHRARTLVASDSGHVSVIVGAIHTTVGSVVAHVESTERVADAARQSAIGPAVPITLTVLRTRNRRGQALACLGRVVREHTVVATTLSATVGSLRCDGVSAVLLTMSAACCTAITPFTPFAFAVLRARLRVAGLGVIDGAMINIALFATELGRHGHLEGALIDATVARSTTLCTPHTPRTLAIDGARSISVAFAVVNIAVVMVALHASECGRLRHFESAVIVAVGTARLRAASPCRPVTLTVNRALVFVATLVDSIAVIGRARTTAEHGLL